MQQFHYWLEKNKATATNYHDGKYWTYGTVQEYRDRDFKFWSLDTVRRTINKLVDLGFILKGNYNKMKMDKTSWYTIDYPVLDTWINKNAKKPDDSAFMQNGNMDSDICQMQDGKISTSIMADYNVPFVQNTTLDDGRLPNAIQENKKGINDKELEKQIYNNGLNNMANTQKAPAPTAADESASIPITPVIGGEVLEPVEMLFNEFWKLYPRKESKDKAKKAWMKLNPSRELFSLIVNALEYRSQTKEWLAEGGRYIPHSATWLNGRRWEDEIDPQKFNQSSILGEQYDEILIDGKLLDPVQRKQMEYIVKQMRERAKFGEE
jgi:hypothetical protein